MKIIFLDVDGVLNCSHCKVFIDEFLFVMDEKIELLRQLIDKTAAKVVLTSTWRQGWYDMEQGLETRDAVHFIALRDKLKAFGIELFSYTPLPCKAERGEEIGAWFQEIEGEEIEGFVILDDMDGRYLRPYANRLVRTSFMEGLKQKHVKLAEKLLNKL